MRIKKILSIFLTAALMLSLLVLPANAESVENTEIFKVEVEAVSAASTLSTSPLIYDKGEVISIKIAASQNTGITGLAMTIDYDEDVLAFIETDSAANDSFIPGAMLFNDVSGVINYLAFSETTVRELGVLAELKFTLKSDACSDALTNITVYPFKNNEKNITNGTKVVPFECVDASFSAHDLNDGIVTDPTCLDNGYTTYHCDVCNKDVIGNITEPTGHFPAAEPVVENYVSASCTVDGSYDDVIYCTVCKAELSRTPNVVEKIGHDLIPHDSKAPTCTEIGWGTYNSCSRCDYTTYVEKPALDHDLTHHEAKDPTCTEIGWDAYDTCSRCDYTTYVEKAALGHTYGESTVVEPEYDAEGYTTHTCTVCGHEEKYDIVPALTYILGDTNGDEVVDSEDAIHLLYYTLLPESISVNQKCDFDGNGDVNSDDAIYLLYYTLLPDQYPLNK